MKRPTPTSRRWPAWFAFVVALMGTRQAYAQATPVSTGYDAPVYRFTRPTPIRRCKVDGTDWTPSNDAPEPPVPRGRSAVAQPGWLFYPIKEVANGTEVIQFLLWKHKDSQVESEQLEAETAALRLASK